MQKESAFRKILVPVDGSHPSEIAQELAVFIAKLFGSKVTVLHVESHEYMTQMATTSFMPSEEREFEPISTTMGQIPRGLDVPKPRDLGVPEEVAKEVVNWYHDRGVQALEDAMSHFKEENIPVNQKLVEKGDPADVIVKEAEKGKYDLIVVGNSEEEKDLHLGSVAKDVTANAKIPVLITRVKTKITSILVPVDGSEKTEKTLEYANAISEKTGAKITLLHVQELSLLQLRPQATKQLGGNILSKAASKIQGAKPELKLEAGDPAKKILELAKQENHDLIIISGKGHSVLRHYLLNSTSDHIIHYSDRSVLLIK